VLRLPQHRVGDVDTYNMLTAFGEWYEQTTNAAPKIQYRTGHEVRGEVPSNRLKDKINVIDTCLEELPPCVVGEALFTEFLARSYWPIRLLPGEHFPCVIVIIDCHRLFKTS